MDLKELFVGAAVVLVGIIAVLSWINVMNDKYDTNVGSTFDSIRKINETLGKNISSVGLELGANVDPQEGGSDADQEAGLIKKGLSSISTMGKFLGLIPSLISDAVKFLRLPGIYGQIAGYVFAGVFALTLASIFFAGLRRLRS